MLLGTDDVGDLHLGVIHDGGEVIEGRAVRPDDHEVADLVRLLLDVPLDRVGQDEPAARRHLEPQRERASLGREPLEVSFACRRAAEAECSLLGLGRGLRSRSGIALGAVVAVNVPRSEELLGGLTVMLGALGLEIRAVWSSNLGPLVPVQPHPAKAVKDLGNRIVDVPFLVGVVDA